MNGDTVLDKVVKEINASRPYMPIIYVETEDRNFIYELLKRNDCFDILKKEEDGSIVPVCYEREMENCNVVFLAKGSVNLKTCKQEKGGQVSLSDWEKRPMYYCVRDFQIWDESAQKKLIETYIKEVVERYEGMPLKKNLILISAVTISVGDEGCCIPNGYDQYVKVIDVPLMGIIEIAQMVTGMQNKMLGNIGVNCISPEEYLQHMDGYIEGFKGMNRSQIQYVLLKLNNIFGCVTYYGLPEKYRKKLSYKKLENTARKMIFEQKSQIIAKSGDIRYLRTDNLVKPGGMAGLEEWILKKKKILDYPLRAREYGEQFSKGILIAGLPGSGKSLTAKYVAQELGIPLIQFKMDMVLQEFVGASEQRLNRVLKLFEASAPCVIWIDEIEKELAGMYGSGDTDSGVNKRCLAKLLNWMQENKKSCFICATANHTGSLPSELLRRGRFDRLYYSFLPMEAQCIEIMYNQFCQMRKDAPALFDDSITDMDLQAICADVFEEISHFERKFFTGSDIEGMLRDAKSELFDDMSKSGGYGINEFREVLFGAAKNTITYSETNFEGLLDYWIDLRFQQFRNAAVPDSVTGDEKYQYMLFDFSDLQYDGSKWGWRNDLKCGSKYEYDKNMFRVLTKSIMNRIVRKGQNTAF